MTYMTWTEMLKVLIYLVIRKKFSNFANENVGVADFWHYTTNSNILVLEI